MNSIDATHDPALRSFVESANRAGHDFPIQNLPFGRFRMKGSNDALRIGVAIGDGVLDLAATGLIEGCDIASLLAMPAAQRRALRAAISEGLREGSAQQGAWSKALIAQTHVEMALPFHIGDYTDFYTGIHHATAVGKLFRPDQPLMPNYKWVPIGYHGRSSSILVSGTDFKRPQGQTKLPDADVPVFGPSKRLDYELELGFVIGPGNALGEPIGIDDAEDHLFGLVLLNDWSARDVQAWEYQPLGPFLAKNFATTISPWVVTMEALAPFRAPFVRPDDEPQPLPYLDGKTNRERGQIDVFLEVLLLTKRQHEAGGEPMRLSLGNARDAAYWTAAQLVAHHSVNGCNLRPGDLLGSGTLSGPAHEQAGSLLELTRGGKEPITLPNGEQRTFLQDGDTLILRGWCEREGAARIGFGEARGMVIG